MVFLSLVVATAVLSPSSAHASTGDTRWESNTFCVDDQTRSGLWPVEEAMAALDSAAPEIHMVYRATYELSYTPACSQFSQSIRVREQLGSRGSRWAGLVGYAYEERGIRDAWVELNLRWPRTLTWGERQTVVLHELLHAIGLGHNDRPDSVMGPNGYDHIWPTRHDLAEVTARYAPRGIDHRPAWRYAMPA